MRDFQSFPIVMNLVIMPLIFLSSAFIPIEANAILKNIAFANPLFYMVDGLRGSLTGTNYFLNPLIDLIIVFFICATIMLIGSYFFSKSEA